MIKKIIYLLLISLLPLKASSEIKKQKQVVAKVKKEIEILEGHLKGALYQLHTSHKNKGRQILNTNKSEKEKGNETINNITAYTDKLKKIIQIYETNIKSLTKKLKQENKKLINLYKKKRKKLKQESANKREQMKKQTAILEESNHNLNQKVLEKKRNYLPLIITILVAGLFSLVTIVSLVMVHKKNLKLKSDKHLPKAPPPKRKRHKRRMITKG